MSFDNIRIESRLSDGLHYLVHRLHQVNVAQHPASIQDRGRTWLDRFRWLGLGVLGNHLLVRTALPSLLAQIDQCTALLVALWRHVLGVSQSSGFLCILLRQDAHS